MIHLLLKHSIRQKTSPDFFIFSHLRHSGGCSSHHGRTATGGTVGAPSKGDLKNQLDFITLL